MSNKHDIPKPNLRLVSFMDMEMDISKAGSEMAIRRDTERIIGKRAGTILWVS